MARRLASNVTIYTNGAKGLGEQLVPAFATDVGIKLDERPITRLEKGPTGSEVIVHLADGQSITEGFLVHFTFYYPEVLRSIHASYLINPLLENIHSPRSGSQTPDGGQWAFCASTITRADGPGGYQNYPALLRKQHPWSVCNRRLQHPAQGDITSRGNGHFRCRWGCNTAGDRPRPKLCC